MKLIRFNKENSTSVRDAGSASVYIHSCGNFCLNKPATDALGVKDGEDYFIEAIQDEENPKDWYFIASTPEVGFKLRKEKTGFKYNFNAGIVAKTLPKSMPSNTSPNTASLLIGKDPITADGLILYPIITSSFKPKKI